MLSPFVLAEIDYFLSRRGRQRGDQLPRRGRCRRLQLGPFASDVDHASGILKQYADLKIGLTDASIVVLAGRYGTNRVLTFDERHFRALRTPAGEPFLVLPADA